MSVKISVAANVGLVLLTLFLTATIISLKVGQFYYRNSVSAIAGGAALQLRKGNTNLVLEVMSQLSSVADNGSLIDAGTKLGVVSIPSENRPTKEP